MVLPNPEMHNLFLGIKTSKVKNINKQVVTINISYASRRLLIKTALASLSQN